VGIQHLIRDIGVCGLLLLFGISACNRYELRPMACPSEPPGLVGSSIAWQQVRDNVRSLRLRVLPITGDVPIASGVQVRLDSVGWRAVDADGAILFDSLLPGVHELAVRAIGYRVARANVRVASDSSIQAVAVMAIDPIRFDGGCGMMYRARKPWWKVW
jgi:hypothetical protein